MLGPARGHGFFATIFDAGTATHRGGCLDLWRGLATGALAGRRQQLEALLETLIAAMPKAPKPAEPLQITRFGRTLAFPDAEEEHRNGVWPFFVSSGSASSDAGNRAASRHCRGEDSRPAS